MTNEQIIMDIAMEIYGKDSVMEMLENGQDIPLHTMQGWAQRGPYRIKKGEHGFETKLWRKKKKKDQGRNENNEDNKDNENNEEKPDNRDFYLCKSFLFRADQIERVEEK